MEAKKYESSILSPDLKCTEAPGKGMHVLLSMSQAEISCNHVQAFSGGSV